MLQILVIWYNITEQVGLMVANLYLRGDAYDVGFCSWKGVE